MTMKIEFETDNAAFEDPAECGSILRHVAAQIDIGMAEGAIQDRNGNKIGRYELTEA